MSMIMSLIIGVLEKEIYSLESDAMDLVQTEIKSLISRLLVLLGVEESNTTPQSIE